MGYMAGPMPLILALVRLYIDARKREQSKQQRLVNLARHPGRIHPYMPDKPRSPPR